MTHHEIERSYDVAPDQPLPDLEALPGVVRAAAPVRTELVATYLDTDDLTLVRAGVTLRRRTGGADAGWHLKVPAGDGRDEVHEPLGPGEHDAQVPPALATLVLGLTRGRPLAPVAVIETLRTTRLLRGADDLVLAELADDLVLGTPSDGAESTVWREVEVELVDAPFALLAAVDALMADAGILPRSEQRKIGTVLAHRLPAPSRAKGSKGRPAGRVLEARLREQVAALVTSDVDVRRDRPDGVHQLRVACRRLRGALATFRPLVERTVTDPVRDELRWVAQSLGEGRDAEVMLERLRDAVDDEPEALVVGPVRARLDQVYGARLAEARAQATALMGSARYLALLDALALLLVDPPWTADAAAPARDVLPALVERDVKRLRRQVRASRDLRDRGEEAGHDEALHEVRKAAKRLRHACETLEPVWGPDAKALRKASQEITRVLGDRQDGAVTRAHLRQIAAEATAAGESAFTYGLLHAREEARSVGLDEEWDDVWGMARDRSLRAWLD